MTGTPDTVRAGDPRSDAAVLAGATIASCGVAAGLVVATARSGPAVVLLGLAVALAVVLVLLDVSWAAAGFLLVLPVGLLDVGPFEVVELAAVGVVVLVVGVRTTAGGTLGVPLVVAAPLAAALLAAGCSTVLSRAPQVGVPALLQLVTGAALMVSVSASLATRAQVRRTGWVLVAVGAGIALSAAAGAGRVTAAYGGAAATGRVEGVFTQPNELGGFAAAVLVAAAGLWAGSRARAGGALALAAMAGIVPGLLLTLSRGAWTGAIVGLLATTVLVLREAGMRRRLGAVWLVALGAGLVLPLLSDHPLARLVGSRAASMLASDGNPHDARPEIYDEAVAQVWQAPALGHGPGSFAQGYAGTVAEGRSGNAEHAHNVVLTLAAELGLLGLATFAALATAVLVVGCTAVRRLRRAGLVADAGLCAGLLGALTTVLAHGLVDYPLRNPTLFLLHWAVAGLVLAYVRLSTAPPSSRGAGGGR